MTGREGEGEGKKGRRESEGRRVKSPFHHPCRQKSVCANGSRMSSLRISTSVHQGAFFLHGNLPFCAILGIVCNLKSVVGARVGQRKGKCEKGKHPAFSSLPLQCEPRGGATFVNREMGGGPVRQVSDRREWGGCALLTLQRGSSKQFCGAKEGIRTPDAQRTTGSPNPPIALRRGRVTHFL